MSWMTYLRPGETVETFSSPYISLTGSELAVEQPARDSSSSLTVLREPLDSITYFNFLVRHGMLLFQGSVVRHNYDYIILLTFTHRLQWFIYTHKLLFQLHQEPTPCLLLPTPYGNTIGDMGACSSGPSSGEVGEVGWP